MSLTDHLIVALAWLSFGAGHSLLAAERVKAVLAPLFGRGYRLAYNLFAALHIGLVLWLGESVLAAGARAFDPPAWLDATRWTVYAAGVAILILALRGYDLGRLGGLTQLRQPDAAEDEPLRCDGLHRFVRHPLYLGAVLLLWGRVGNEAQLATALWGTLYLWVGAAFEERKLRRHYGDAYRDYQARVPAVIPWKGRAL